MVRSTFLRLEALGLGFVRRGLDLVLELELEVAVGRCGSRSFFLVRR